MVAWVRRRIRSLTAVSLAALAAVLAWPLMAAAVPAAARPGRPYGITPPHHLIAPLPPLRWPAAVPAVSAAQTCVRYASRAGFANNGYYSGDLVTAAAICMAESGGQATVYACDANGRTVGVGYYTPGKAINCPSGTTSYDRGLWQFNSVYAPKVSNACAFDPTCNAGQAYLYSDLGTAFSPWATYDSDAYARPYIDLAQAAATAASTGTITSAMLGECLARSRVAANAPVVLGDCGTGAAAEQWTLRGSRLLSGGLCAAVTTASGTPGVVLRHCNGSRWQDWQRHGRDELRDAAAGRCLTDPGGSLTAGTQVLAASCTNAKDQVWWLP